MRKGFGLSLLAVVMLMLTITGCEKKRKARFVQGDGEYVYAINDFQGATYTLKTGKRITRGVTTKADKIVVENSDVIRSFDAVEFSVETEFGTFDNESMSNFQFHGRENDEYLVSLSFTEDNLVFFKVAAPEAIPSDEMTYAEKGEANLYRVPLFGLPLSKYAVENVKDDRNKTTNQLATFPKEFLKDASHFSVKPKNPKYFTSEIKLDMFPANFFDENNEWFYEVTVVDRPVDQNTVELGEQLVSGKAKFFKTNKSITVVSQNIPDELKTQDPEKQTTVLEIPARWMDFRLLTTGEEAYLKEEVFNDIAAGAKYWKDRQYVQLQFDRILSGAVSTDSVVAETLRIKRLEVSDNYLSFVVFDALSKLSLHFSFAKENRVIEGINYPLEDGRKFGLFSAFKSTLGGALVTSVEANEKLTFMTRMYPPQNEIRFYTTESTPRDPLFLEAIDAAIKAWDNAFVEASKGTAHEANPLRVVLDQNRIVQNGDARFHKISFFGYEVASGLLGYGPSITDDRSGEIFSSTNNIYLRNYREMILENLKSYVRHRIGVTKDLDLQGIDLPNQVLVTSNDLDYDFSTFTGGSHAGLNVNALPAVGKALMQSKLSSKPTKIDIVKARKDAIARNAEAKQRRFQVSRGNRVQDLISARKNLESGAYDYSDFLAANQRSKQSTKKNGSCNYSAASALSFKEIEEICLAPGNRFKSYLEELLAKNASEGLDYRLDDEKEAFYDCAQKLMKPTLIATLVHEFGHNFGLTHNFAGSTDYKNFPRNAEGAPKVRSTSVMDYAHADADRGFAPGPYDVATIRYGYYRAVELQDKNGASAGMVSIDTKASDIRPIEQRLKGVLGADKQLRPFSYCWDYDISDAESPLETPNCRRHDQGADPVSQVRAMIDNTNALITSWGNRFDDSSAADPLNLALAAASRELYPMKHIYDKYRYSLYEKAFARGKNDPYFDIFSAAEIENQILGADNLAKVADLEKRYHALNQAGAEANRKALALELEVQALPEIAQYKLASEMVKDFVKQLAFADDLYCVAVAPVGNAFEAVEIVPFPSLRKSVFNYDRSETSRCEDEAVLNYFKNAASLGAQFANYANVTRVISVGNPTKEVLSSADIQKIPVRGSDRSGIEFLRLMASIFFAERSDDAMGVALFQINSFFPSFLDEEAYRKEILNEIHSRYVDGVNGTKLLAQASARLGASVAPGKAFAGLVNETGVFNLPYYEEETSIVSNLLSSYIAGAISPRSITNEKVEDVMVSSSPEVSFLNFIRTAPDAAEYEYFIAGSTAFYSKGSLAKAVLKSMTETSDSVALAEDMTRSVQGGQLTAASQKQVQVRINRFVEDFIKDYTSGDATAKTVLFKVRLCVKDALSQKYKSLMPQIRLEEDANFPYIEEVCRATNEDGTPKTSTAVTKYVGEAERLIAFIVERDTKIISPALFESILTSVGLPAAADPAKELTDILFEALDAELPGEDFPSYFESVVYQIALGDLLNTEEGSQALFGETVNQPVVDKAIQAAFESLSAEIAPYAKYRELYKKKVDILQSAIFQSAQ